MMGRKMAIKLLLATAAMVLSTASAYADFFYKLVGYQCDKKANAVVLTYTRVGDEANRKAVKNKASQQWDPWKLIVKTKDGNFIRSTRIIERQCELDDGTYDVRIGPLPGNGNLQGMCGAFMTAWAEVRRDSKIILPRHAFEHGDCHVTEPVTTKIIIEAGDREPIIHKVPWDDFHKIGAGKKEL